MRPAFSGPMPTASVAPVPAGPGLADCTSRPSEIPAPSGACEALMSKKSPLMAATVVRPSPGSCSAASSLTGAASATLSGAR